MGKPQEATTYGSGFFFPILFWNVAEVYRFARLSNNFTFQVKIFDVFAKCLANTIKIIFFPLMVFISNILEFSNIFENIKYNLMKSKIT